MGVLVVYVRGRGATNTLFYLSMVPSSRVGTQKSISITMTLAFIGGTGAGVSQQSGKLRVAELKISNKMWL